MDQRDFLDRLAVALLAGVIMSAAMKITNTKIRVLLVVLVAMFIAASMGALDMLWKPYGALFLGVGGIVAVFVYIYMTERQQTKELRRMMADNERSHQRMIEATQEYTEKLRESTAQMEKMAEENRAAFERDRKDRTDGK